MAQAWSAGAVVMFRDGGQTRSTVADVEMWELRWLIMGGEQRWMAMEVEEVDEKECEWHRRT